MEALIAFWTHALAAALFASLTLWELRRGIRIGSDQRMLLAALRADRLLGLADRGRADVACSPPMPKPRATWSGSACSTASPTWRRQRQRQRGVQPVYAAVAGVSACSWWSMRCRLWSTPAMPAAHALSTAIILRLTAAAGALVLVHNLYGQAAPASRGGIRLAMLALAAMWAYDLNLYTIAYFDHGCGARPVRLARAGAGARPRRCSRSARRAATAGASACRAPPPSSACRCSRSAAYFAVMAVLATALRGTGFDWTRNVAVALLARMTVARWSCCRQPARARLGQGQDRQASVRASLRLSHRMAALHRNDRRMRARGRRRSASAWSRRSPTSSMRPAACCLSPTKAARSSRAADWNWPGAPPRRRGQPRGAAAFWRAVAAEGRIIDFDALRGGWADAATRHLAIPAALLGEDDAWAGVPLIHEERLVGLVLLAAPDYRRPLDWEDFDLLRTAGRQAASTSPKPTASRR